MIDSHFEDTTTLIDDLNPGLVIHDIAFDWTGKRIALACSDKTVKIYVKDKKGWNKEDTIRSQGPSIWKIKWARPENGIFLLTCSLDHTFRLYQFVFRDKFEWQYSSNFINRKLQDIKFSPLPSFGLNFALVTADGKLQLIKYPSKTTQDFITPNGIQINRYGLNCLSWSKGSQKNSSIIAIGAKSHDTTPLRVFNGQKSKPSNFEQITQKNTLTFYNVFFDKESSSHSEIQVPSIKITSAVNDVSWAFVNARSYHLLGVVTNNGATIYELKVTEMSPETKSITLLQKYSLTETQGFRLSWNLLGTYISITESKKVKIFRAMTRGNWENVKQIVQK